MIRCLGYDPSSTLGGWAVTDDCEPVQIGVWKPSKNGLSPIDRLAEFDIFCGFLMATYKPDVATVEVIRVSTSHDTTRALSRFEGVFIARAMGAGAEVIEYQVGQARAALFGDGLGTLQKEQAFAAMRSRYPNLPWLPQDKGGMDQSDALVPAMCWREIKERKVAIDAEKKAAAKAKREKKKAKQPS